MIGSLIGKIHRESMTRRWKVLLRDCYCRDDEIDNAGSAVVPSAPTVRLSDNDFNFVKDDINLVKYSWYHLLYYIKCSKNKLSKLMLIQKIVKSFISIIDKISKHSESGK